MKGLSKLSSDSRERKYSVKKFLFWKAVEVISLTSISKKWSSYQVALL